MRAPEQPGLVGADAGRARCANAWRDAGAIRAPRFGRPLAPPWPGSANARALHWFRQALLGDDPRQIAEAAHVIADEGLTLLWPELDRLLDVDNAVVVLHAREAVEQMAEEMEQSRSWSF